MNELKTKDILFINQYIQKMTIREKIGQCVMIEPVLCLEDLNHKYNHTFTSITDKKFLDILFNQYHIGMFLFGGITRLGDSSMQDWGKHLKEINKIAKEYNHTPLLFGVDAVHGVNFVKGTTIFPHNIGVAASWNPDLAKSYMSNVSSELDSIGFNVNFAPTIDVARDPRWGRVYESLGEDPYLARKMTSSLIEGVQESSKVSACAKHFVGYGESANGMDRTPADISERTLREIHLPPFEEAIKKGVQTIMVNGGDYNGVPAPASKYLLTKLLREELGFKGITLSDWEDVSRLVDRHFVVKDKKQAIMRAFNAGLDINMAVSDLETVDIMEQLVQDGDIAISRLDEAVFRIIKTKYQLGLFEKNEIDLHEIYNRTFLNESKKIAESLALESITLLKNESNILPISEDIKELILVGKASNSKRHLCGGWTLNWASADEEDLEFDTIYDQLVKQLPKTNITLVENNEDLQKIINAKKHFDICINFVSEEPHSEWLGDSFDLEIEEEELELLTTSKQLNIPQVMVSIIGRPRQLMEVSKQVTGILWCFLPGSEGAKPIVEILLGKKRPSGKLPITFPKSANQVPCVYNARRYQSSDITTSYDPLYPFGYGLSYDEVEYSKLELELVNEQVKVSVTIKNQSCHQLKETVQVYMKDLFASVTRPLKSLKAFKKVFLDSYEEKVVELFITKEDLSLYDEMYQYVYESREIEINVKDLSKRVKIG